MSREGDEGDPAALPVKPYTLSAYMRAFENSGIDPNMIFARV